MILGLVSTNPTPLNYENNLQVLTFGGKACFN
jgi:hypothetical protein